MDEATGAEGREAERNKETGLYEVVEKKPELTRKRGEDISYYAGCSQYCVQWDYGERNTNREIAFRLRVPYILCLLVTHVA